MKKIGLLVAMEEEAAHIYTALGEITSVEYYGNVKITSFAYKGVEIFMAGSGIGEISAAIATSFLILEKHVETVINFGVVGSLKSCYKAKDILLVNEVVHYDYSLLLSDDNAYGKYPFNNDSFVNAIDLKTLNLAEEVLGAIQKVRIATGDKFVNKSDYKNWLTEHFDCGVCDMESMGIYLTCKNAGIPLFMLKTVSDNADESAAIDIEETIKDGVTYYIEAVKKLIEKLKTK